MHATARSLACNLLRTHSRSRSRSRSRNCSHSRSRRPRPTRSSWVSIVRRTVVRVLPSLMMGTPKSTTRAARRRARARLLRRRMRGPRGAVTGAYTAATKRQWRVKREFRRRPTAASSSDALPPSPDSLPPRRLAHSRMWQVCELPGHAQVRGPGIAKEGMRAKGSGKMGSGPGPSS